MYGSIVVLAAGLLALLLGAKTFTNGIEWLGKRLNLSEGAVGSVLAAVGTALPETMIPVIAIIFGPAGSAHEVGIGAILGAPFMLSTLAFGVVGISKICYFRNSERSCIEVKNSILMRDLKYFICFYTLVISAAFVQIQAYKYFVAAMLLVGYIYYMKKTVRDGDSLGNMELEPLYFWKKDSEPPLVMPLAQVAAGLMLIIGGATYFVDALGNLATSMMVPALLLSLVITPVATELPEKVNSVIWVKGGKDTLAMGNITGAMVFQSTIVPIMGILFTPWTLTPLAALSAGLALLSSLTIYLIVKKQKELKAKVMFLPAALYGVFILLVVAAGL